MNQGVLDTKTMKRHISKGFNSPPYETWWDFLKDCLVTDFHIFHAAEANISKKQGPWNAVLACAILGRMETLGIQRISRASQHLIANRQVKKRLSQSSIWSVSHRMHAGPSSTCQFFRNNNNFCVQSIVTEEPKKDL